MDTDLYVIAESFFSDIWARGGVALWDDQRGERFISSLSFDSAGDLVALWLGASIVGELRETDPIFGGVGPDDRPVRLYSPALCAQVCERFHHFDHQRARERFDPTPLWRHGLGVGFSEDYDDEGLATVETWARQTIDLYCRAASQDLAVVSLIGG